MNNHPRQRTAASRQGQPSFCQWPTWLTYIFALVVTISALWVRLILNDGIGDRPMLILFLIPITLSAYLGGLGPGLVSTAVAAVGLVYLFLPPTTGISIARSIDIVQWMVLIILGTLVSVISGALHRSRRNAEVTKDQLSLITNAVPALVSYVDADYRYRNVNQTYELWFGLKERQILGKHVRELLGDEVWEKIRPYMELAMSGERVSYEQELLYRYGGSRWVHVSYTPDHNDHGRVRGIVVLGQDISRSKSAEKERDLAVDFLRIVNVSRDKKDMIRTTLTFFQEHSGCEAVGIRLYEEGDYPYYEVRGFPVEFVLAENSLCSRSATGEVIRDCTGSPVLDCMCGNIICGRVDPSKPFFTRGGSFWSNCTTDLLASTTDADRQARTRNRCNGEGYESVALIALRVGEERLGLLQLNDRRKDRFSPEDISLWERLAGYLAVALAKFQADEALQQSKEKIGQILNSTAEGIYGLDPVSNCTFCNPSGIRILGYHDETDLIGKNMHELIHYTKADGTSYPSDECVFCRAISKGEYSHWDKEILWRSDGTSFPSEFWTHPIFKDHELIGTVVTFIDITERVTLENQLLHAQKMEAVGTLAGGIAHDFNNILSAILGYADLLHMKMLVDDPLRTNVEEILESVERAAQLTHSLLAFSRNQLMTVKAVDLVDLISRLSKMLIRIIGEDIEFRTEFRQKSLVVMADSGQVEQVIMNLAANARDAMPKGGTLTIVADLAEIDEAICEAHGCDMAGKYVIISVSDSGTGMSEEIRKRMFDPFFTTKNIGKGTGLGLSMVYGIVRQHNGFIDVDSEQGKGTTFRIYLPAIPAIEDKKSETTQLPDVDKGTETILVAEDDPALRKLSRIVLESFGYKVIQAVDGQDAVKKFTAYHNGDIGLVILDMMMPKMTGMEAYEAIKDIRPEVKALFLSGYTADKIKETGLISDGMEIVMKPISPRDLLRTVRRVLDSRS